MPRSIFFTRRAILAAAGTLPLLARPAGAEQASPAAQDTEFGVVVEPLFEDARVQLDKNGRIQLAQITFAPGAELPEDFLTGALGAIVESGSFQVVVGSDPALTLETGDRTEAAAGEVARSGVRVNAVCPGPIDTRMIHSLESQLNPANPASVGDRYRANLPIGRYGTAEEVANVVLFLCSDLAGNVTGAHYVIDGGRSATGGSVTAQKSD